MKLQMPQITTLAWLLFIFLQINPIAFAGRTFNSKEEVYSQIDDEGVSVIFIVISSTFILVVNFLLIIKL